MKSEKKYYPHYTHFLVIIFLITGSSLLRDNANINITLMILCLIFIITHYLSFIKHKNDYVTFLNSGEPCKKINTDDIDYDYHRLHLAFISVSQEKCFLYIMYLVTFNFQYMILKSNFNYWIIGLSLTIITMGIFYILILRYKYLLLNYVRAHSSKNFRIVTVIIFEILKIVLFNLLAYYVLRYPLINGNSFIMFLQDLDKFSFNKQSLIGTIYLVVFYSMGFGIDWFINWLYAKIAKTKKKYRNT